MLATPAARPAAFALCLVVLFAAVVTGQEPPLDSAAIELSVTSPGARALGFAGAFAAIADDATAAWTNPAGLGQLVRPEVSCDIRMWSFSDDPGGAGGFAGVGFASFVYPVRRWTFAVYVHQLANLDFGDGYTLPVPTSGVTPPAAVIRPWFTGLTVVNLGASVSLRASERLTLGLGLTDAIGSFTALGGIGVDLLSVDGDTSKAGAVAGVTWRVSERWSAGAAYRPGPRLDFALDVRSTIPGVDDQTTSLEVVFPDTLAVGAAYRSTSGRWITSVEWDRLASPVLADRNQLHLGGEYVILDSTPLVGLRLGVWRDPAVAPRPETGAVPSALVPADSDRVHVTTGVGIAFKRLQLDLAFDHSRSVNVGSLSAIYSF